MTPPEMLYTEVPYYQVIVGNVGTVYSGPSRILATQNYSEYRRQSRAGHGRAANEPVTVMRDGEPMWTHEPEEVEA